jgi:hypothetical protein
MSALASEEGHMDKVSMARRLAEEHLNTDPYLESVFLLEPPHGKDLRAPIRLLEVVDGTLEGDPLPIGFAADPERGRPYPFAIVEISPREYRALSNGHLKIHDDIWTVGERLVAR